MIGIAITTKDRTKVLQFTINQFKKYTTEDMCFVVVDDHSTETMLHQIFANSIGDYIYNDENLGVARTKNVCIKYLMSKGCDHIFLFDDDCFPVAENWHLPWVNSGEHHLNFCIDTHQNIIDRKENVIWWDGCLGCCMYFTRECIEKVGGYDKRYAKYGYEHYELTERIHRAGITPHARMSPIKLGAWSFDAQDSHKLFVWGRKSCLSKGVKDEGISENLKVHPVVMEDKTIFRDI
uniref:Putative glycosyltransferase n=1 Tax=viral metagenome TaxID=1070528 RepID=A0A6M3ITG9_9ZZZZ